MRPSNNFAYPILLLCCITTASDANVDGVNVNVKSKTLSNILQPQADPSIPDVPATPTSTQRGSASASSSSSTENTQKKAGMSNLISLDLAGELQTHICSPSFIAPNGIEVGPAAHDDVRTNPLFRWGKVHANINHDKCSKIPTVHVGAKYDFKNVWYGATRLMTTLSWGNPRPQSTNVVSKLSGEVGLLQSDDYSMQLAIKFPNGGVKNQRRSSSLSPERMLSARYDTRSFGGHSATLAGSTLLHPRLGVVVKGIVLLGEQGLRGITRDIRRGVSSEDARAQFISRIPQDEVSWSEGSWLPDVKMTAGGKIVTNSAIGLKRSRSGNNRIGVRLMVSRQLDWNIIGMFQGADEAEYDNDTMLRLEVGGFGSDSYTSISAEAAIERISQTFKCTLLQERIFCI